MGSINNETNSANIFGNGFKGIESIAKKYLMINNCLMNRVIPDVDAPSEGASGSEIESFSDAILYSRRDQKESQGDKNKNREHSRIFDYRERTKKKKECCPCGTCVGNNEYHQYSEETGE